MSKLSLTTLLGGRTQKALLSEVAEFRVLKNEINKARCVLELNARGEITAVNDNLSKCTGWRAEALTGQHLRKLLPAEEAAEAAFQTFWQGLQQGQSQTGQFRLLTLEGQIRWMQGYYAPVCDAPHQGLRKVVAYLTDITADKNQLIENQQESTALNHAFGVAEISAQGVFVSCNEAFAKSLGYQIADVIGKPQTAFVCSKEVDTKQRHVQQQLQTGEVVAAEVCRISKSGEQLWFQTTYVPVKNLDGRVYKIMMYSYCITMEKRANLDLTGRLAAVDRAQAMIEFDLQGTILNINDNFTKVMGYTKAEIVGKNHSLMVSESYRSSKEYQSFWDKLRNGEFESGYFPRLNKKGEEVWLQASYNPIVGLDGKISRVVKYAIDITETVKKDILQKKQAREALMIKNALESSSNNLMVANNDGIITYMNPATLSLMRHSSDTFRSKFPQFDADKLIGQNFDQFHKNPHHQRNLLGSLTGKHTTELNLGNMYFRLTANPIYDNEGERMGSVVEWVDLTEEKRVENEIREAVEAAVSGDVTQRLDLSTVKGSMAKTMEAVNQLLDSIHGILQQVREAGETINTAAHEISTGNNDLSSRTEQQASNLEETASSMEQLSSTVRQNADNARQANQMAEAASLVAQRGGEVVGNVVSTMSAINESAKKIEEIITVIDGIAFQTNILALNAAVEAARAGEQGRGFAVVAGEVRNLAQRSASAAKEIKGLITDSVTKTAEGTKLVESAGITMNEIVSSVQRVTDIMSEITAASAEQSAGIDQVNNAITDMDEVTQQNAALVEEAAAAAESLVEQAATLMDTVSKFKLQGGQSPLAQASYATRSAAVARKPAPRSTSNANAAAASRSKMAIAASQKHAAPLKTGTDDEHWEEF